MSLYRIGGDAVKDHVVTILDRDYHLLARPLFKSGIAIVGDVASPDGDRDWIGGLIMSRWIKSKSGKNDRRIWVYYDDIFSLLRAIYHGLEGYEQDKWGSLLTIRQAVASTTQLQASLLGLR